MIFKANQTVFQVKHPLFSLKLLLFNRQLSFNEVISHSMTPNRLISYFGQNPKHKHKLKISLIIRLYKIVREIPNPIVAPSDPPPIIRPLQYLHQVSLAETQVIRLNPNP